MLTKKQLFEEILNLGISWNRDPTGFRLAAKNILLSEYDNVSEETLDRYLKSFFAKIAKISKEHKNSPVKKMLDSKRHISFYDTVINFSTTQVQPQVTTSSVQAVHDVPMIQDFPNVQDVPLVQDVSNVQNVPLVQDQPSVILQHTSIGTLTDESWLKRQNIKRKRQIRDDSGGPSKQRKVRFCSRFEFDIGHLTKSATLTIDQ